MFDVRSFEGMVAEASARTPRLLDMTEADLVDEALRGETSATSRRAGTQGDQVLSLAYRFEPGAPDDGVTAVVPLALLAQLRPDGFDWQVPGLRDELIAGLHALAAQGDPPPRGARRGLGGHALGRASTGRARSPRTDCRRWSLRDALAARIQRGREPAGDAARTSSMERVPSTCGCRSAPSTSAVAPRARTATSGIAAERGLADRARC